MLESSNGVHEPTCVHRSHNKLWIAAGYTNGEIRVYRYPCSTREAPYVSRTVHVGEVSKVRFTLDDKHLVSAGRFDRAIVIIRALV